MKKTQSKTWAKKALMEKLMLGRMLLDKDELMDWIPVSEDEAEQIIEEGIKQADRLWKLLNKEVK